MPHTESKLFRAYGKHVYTIAPIIIIFWVVFTGLLNLFIPQLEKTIADKSVPFFPDSNSGIIALKNMSYEFENPPSSGLTNFLFVNDNGINAEDTAYYHRLTHKLADTPEGRKNIAYLIDIYQFSTLKNVVMSKDGKAIYLIGLMQGQIGSAETEKAWEWINEVLKDPQLHKPKDLQVVLAGPTTIFVDEMHAIDKAMITITAVSVVLITLMLVFVYRSIVTACIPLMNIGLSLACSRAVISFLGQKDWLAVSSFSVTLSTAVILGAGTDYAIFLIGRYHEERRKGIEPVEALSIAIARVKGIVLASGLTIAASSYSMVFLHIGLFRTAGPPIAIGVLITIVVSFTFCLSTMAVAIWFKFLDPKTKNRARFWRKRALFVLRRPVPLAAILTLLLILSSTMLLGMKTGYMENETYSSQAESNQAFALSDQHYAPYSMLQEYLFVRTDHDLRNAKDLAALELAAQAISTHPVIAKVQSLSRPNGEPYPLTTISRQANIVSKEIKNGLSIVQEYLPLLHELVDGSSRPENQSASTLNRMPELSGVGKIINLAKNLFGSLDQVDDLLKDTTHGQLELNKALPKLHEGAKILINSINEIGGSNIQPIINILVSVNNFLQKLDTPKPDSECAHDGFCMKARSVYASVNDMSHGAAHGLAVILSVLPRDLHDFYPRLLAKLPQLKQIDTGLGVLISKLGTTQPKALLNQTYALVNELGVLTKKLEGLTGKLHEGIEFLDGVYSTTPLRSGGYYMPPRGFKYRIYLEGSTLLISPNGKAARMVLTFNRSPFDPKVFTALPEIYELAHNAMRGTGLANAEVSSTGTAGIYYGFKSEVQQDTLTLAIITIVAVTLILMFLLRCLIAPLIVMGFVLLSFGTTMGITVLMSQYILGHQLHWSVLPVAMITMVAVGADYSMLFVSRIRDEVESGLRHGIIRAFESTGSVISIAGIVFAVTMFALLSGGVENLEQIGFAVGTGLLIDITVVRTMLVPAVLVVFGEWAWWPSKNHLTTEKDKYHRAIVHNQ